MQNEQTTHLRGADPMGRTRFDRDELLRALQESPRVYVDLKEIVEVIDWWIWQHDEYGTTPDRTKRNGTAQR